MPPQNSSKKKPTANSEGRIGAKHQYDRIEKAITSLRVALTKEADANRKESSREDSGNKWIAVATLTFVFFTTLGIFYQASILNSSDTTFKGTLVSQRETSEQQLRAYVGVSTSVPLNMKPDHIELTMDNFGQTPANHVKFFSNWEFLRIEQQLPKDFSFPEKKGCEESQNVMLGDGPIFPKNALPARRLHCPDEINNLRRAARREINGFYYGHIEYEDIFGKQRRTNFCFLYISGGSTLCDRYNEIDPKP